MITQSTTTVNEHLQQLEQMDVATRIIVALNELIKSSSHERAQRYRAIKREFFGREKSK